ncbi:MAG: hypothetical protein M9962_01040 [Oligoflexia bacterium]|nr:hypothetical protein [Oligoflexia bacterium]
MSHNKVLGFFVLSLLVMPSLTYGFGGKPKHFSKIKGTSEVQVKTDQETGMIKVFLRGKAAETTYYKLDVKEKVKSDSAALKLTKSRNLIYWVKDGKQLSCAKIQEIKGELKDFACEFSIDVPKGNIAKAEPFTNGDFNYGQTKTAAKFFKRTGGRSLASANHSYGVVSSFLISEKKKDWKEKSDNLIVIKGVPAQSLMGFIKEQKSTKVKEQKNGRIQQSKYIGCVEHNGAEAERCAFVISMKDGAISRDKNPLLP